MSSKLTKQRVREVRGAVIIDNIKLKNHKYIVFKSFTGQAYRPKVGKKDRRFWPQPTSISQPKIMIVTHVQPRAKRVWLKSLRCDVELLLSSQQIGQCMSFKSYSTLEEAETMFETYWIKKNL